MIGFWEALRDNLIISAMAAGVAGSVVGTVTVGVLVSIAEWPFGLLIWIPMIGFTLVMKSWMDSR